MKFISCKEIRPGDIISMGPTWLDTKQDINLIGPYVCVVKIRRMSSGVPYQDIQKTVTVDHLLVLKVVVESLIQVLEPSGATCFISGWGCTIIKHA